MDSISMRFELGQKEILNANSLPSHYIVKGKLAAALRAIGAQAALDVHPDGDAAKKRFESIRAEEELKVLKSRARKKMNKTGATDEEIAEKLASISKEFEVEAPSSSITVEYPFHCFTVDVVVQPPTRRRFDPPNLYPTVKPLVDGMTDASFWEDDSFDQLVSMSFRAGGTSGIPKTFIVTLNIKSVEN